VSRWYERARYHEIEPPKPSWIELAYSAVALIGGLILFAVMFWGAMYLGTPSR
jgi:hypothetical protein